MHIAITNVSAAKLGPGVLIINRPVGDTCPTTCPLHPEAKGPLGGTCYMIRIENMRPAIRKAALENMVPDRVQLDRALAMAARDGRLVRLHPGGDFLDASARNLDLRYINSLASALDGLDKLPRVLAYTHCIDRRLVARLGTRIQLFASVHGDADCAYARAQGFTRFALVMPERVSQWDGGAWIKRHGERFLVCPEQRGKIKDCVSCGYCWRPDRGSVAFLEHSRPREEQLARMKRRKASGKGLCAGHVNHQWGEAACNRCGAPVTRRVLKKRWAEIPESARVKAAVRAEIQAQLPWEWTTPTEVPKDRPPLQPRLLPADLRILRALARRLRIPRVAERVREGAA